VEIISVKKMISAQYYDNFIKEFVELNDEIRKISPIHKIIGKNNNNTFYGRLGMNPERLEEEITNKLDIDKYEKVVEINGAFIGYKKKEKSISNVLISASITSKARIKLYKGIDEVIKNGGRILYTDTDSIIAAFKKVEYKNKLDIKMGEVVFDSSNMDTVISEGVFAMPKTYAVRYKDGREIVKIKGFNVRPSFDEFKEKFYNKEEIITENIE
jgi:chorismate synthase